MSCAPVIEFLSQDVNTNATNPINPNNASQTLSLSYPSAQTDESLINLQVYQTAISTSIHQTSGANTSQPDNRQCDGWQTSDQMMNLLWSFAQSSFVVGGMVGSFTCKWWTTSLGRYSLIFVFLGKVLVLPHILQKYS